MRITTAGLVVAVLAVGAAAPGSAQSRGWAVTPHIGYTLPMNNLVEFADASIPGYLQVEPTGGIMVGLTGELGLNKQFAISGFVSSTVGLTQNATWHYSFGPTAADKFDIDRPIATLQAGATFVVRPLGRLPNGAPKVFFLEAGMGLNQFQVPDITARQDTSEVLSWNSMVPGVLFGGGLTFRIGPRSTMVVFARYHMALGEYSSAGLDDWNSNPPPDPGQKVNVLFIGAGLRTGR